MLIRLDEKNVIKSDRYQFMLCHDMGPTKFPGGVISLYFKPVGFYGQMDHIRIEHSDLQNFIKLQDNLLKLIKESKYDLTDFEVFGFKVNHDRDCYVVKIGSGYNLYHNNINGAIISAWNHFIRGDKFGSTGGNDVIYGTFSQLNDEVSLAEKTIKELAVA